ncbi:hypothetical protein ABID20_000840 [Rhizobium alvei]
MAGEIHGDGRANSASGSGHEGDPWCNFSQCLAFCFVVFKMLKYIMH